MAAMVFTRAENVLRPSEIDGEEKPAHADGRESDQIRKADEGSILALPKEIHQGGEEVAAAGETTQEKVGDDQPAPVGGGGEEGARHRHLRGSGS